MRCETAEQKEQRMFDWYFDDLVKLAARCPAPDTLRFNCIEYVCSFPKIDPVKMGRALADEGIEIVFDDSSISQKENERKRRKVYGRR